LGEKKPKTQQTENPKTSGPLFLSTTGTSEVSSNVKLSRLSFWCDKSRNWSDGSI